MSNNPSETRVVFGLDYDNWRLANPFDDFDDEDKYFNCAICLFAVSSDEYTEVEFRGKIVQCCGFCKEQVLTGEIK